MSFLDTNKRFWRFLTKFDQHFIMKDLDYAKHLSSIYPCIIPYNSWSLIDDWDKNSARTGYNCNVGTTCTYNIGHFSERSRKNADVTLYFNKILIILNFLRSKMIIKEMKLEPLVSEDMTSNWICTADPYFIEGVKNCEIIDCFWSDK